MGLGHWNRNSLHSEPHGSGHKAQGTSDETDAYNIAFVSCFGFLARRHVGA